MQRRIDSCIERIIIFFLSTGGWEGDTQEDIQRHIAIQEKPRTTETDRERQTENSIIICSYMYIQLP